MSNPLNTQKRQYYLMTGIFFILISVALLIYVFYLQWINSVMS